jgi:hypothetical protein
MVSVAVVTANQGDAVFAEVVELLPFLKGPMLVYCC